MENRLTPVLVLDFDGVLVSLDINWAHVRQEVSKALGIPISSLNVFWEQYHGTEMFKKANDIAEKYEFQALERAHPKEDLGAALSGWSGRCYIASLQSEKVLKLFVERFKLQPYISEMLDRIAFGSKKRQLEYVMLKEGRDNCVVIDDSKINQKMCAELGLRCIPFNINKDRIHDIISKLNS